MPQEIPAELAQPVRDDIETSPLSDELISIFNDPKTIKLLSTTDEDGTPHSVVKNSFRALDSRTLAYMEIIFRSRSYQNALRNKDKNKRISIAVFNPETMVSYQIKGELVVFFDHGPLWDQMRNELWSMIPDATPAGVWVIAPKEVINEDYSVQQDEVDKRIIHSKLWRQFFGKKPKHPDFMIKK